MIVYLACETKHGTDDLIGVYASEDAAIAAVQTRVECTIETAKECTMPVVVDMPIADQ